MGYFLEHDKCGHCGDPKVGRYSNLFCSDRCERAAIGKHLPSYVSYNLEPRIITRDFTESREGFLERDAEHKRHLEKATATWLEQAERLKRQEQIREEVHADFVLEEARAEGHRLRKERLEQEAKLEKERVERERDRPIPDSARTEHTLIIAPSGAGKTTLYQQLIFDDLKAAEKNPAAIPSMVIIDPKGFMVERISKLLWFNPQTGLYRDRIMIIDPVNQPRPALNVFRSPDNDTRSLNKLIESFAYIFSSSEAALTQRQGIPFSYVVGLVFHMGGDIRTLMDVLEEQPPRGQQSKYAPYIAAYSKTNEGAARFFANDFFGGSFVEARGQIKTRLHEIFRRPELMQMVAAPQNKLDIFSLLQRGTIILINTARDELGAAASALLGRYFITLTLNAVYQRSRIPRSEWRRTYLLIDEFAQYCDLEKTPEMLRLAREYNLGITMAIQDFDDEVLKRLATTLVTNTAIKYSSSPGGTDANFLARDMLCDPDWLRRVQKNQTHARFAVHVRGMIPPLEHPFIHEAKFGDIEQSANVMSDALYTELKATMRRVLAPDVASNIRDADYAVLKRQLLPERPASPLSNDLHTGDHGEPADRWGDE
jgi:hypothetical protein